MMSENNRVAVIARPGDGHEIDDNQNEYDVIVGTSNEGVTNEIQDPFSQSAEVFKTMAGLSPASKKRASRSFQKFHDGANGAKSKKIEDKDIYGTGYEILGVVTPPYNLDYLARLYHASEPHYAASNAKIDNIVGLGYDFIDSPKLQQAFEEIDTEDKRQKADKKRRRAKQDMLDWLDSCNEEDEFVETLKKLYADYFATGNAYMEIGRTANGEIGYIGHIPSTTIRVRRKRDGFVQIVGNKTTFFRHFAHDTADPIGDDPEPNEIIHLKKYSPLDSYYGVPDIVAATRSVAGNEFASRYNLDYFENKAVPRYVIVIKGGKLSNRAEQTMVNFFESHIRGKNHRTLYIPLPAETSDHKVSFEMKPIEAGVQDASFINYDKINTRNIFMVHRTPISKATVTEGISLAAARDADKTFKESVCRPEQKVFEKKFRKVIAERTDMFLFKLNELALSDEDTQSKIDERYLRMQVVVPNEIRARDGRPGIKGGDKPVELKPQVAAEQKAQAGKTRQRDASRSAGATDSAGEGGNAKGEGRTTG
jgi:PBSX family phage portal protein